MIEPRFVRKGCAEQLEIAILPQFLTIEPHFVRKGCAGQLEIAILPQCERVARDNLKSQFISVFDDRTHFVRKGCAGQLEIVIYLSF